MRIKGAMQESTRRAGASRRSRSGLGRSEDAGSAMRDGFRGTGALLAALALGALGASIGACEHHRYWRGGEPRSAKETRASVRDDDGLTLLVSMAPAAPAEQSKQAALAKSAGCMSCHGPTDEADMHPNHALAIGCTDCHGGDATVMTTLAAPGRPPVEGGSALQGETSHGGSENRPTQITDAAYLAAMQKAHVLPRNAEAWYGGHDLMDGRGFGEHHASGDPALLHGSRTPENTAALLNQESPEFIRFINPGDLRIANLACGECHREEVANVGHSMMTHGAMLWGAALYNNGAIPDKRPRFGESYSMFGAPQRLQGVVEVKTVKEGEDEMQRVGARWPTQAELDRGALPALDPLPTWNVSQPGNVLRIFERGTRSPVPGTANPAEPGNPNVLAEGGRPDKGLSPRGLGTLNRTDPVFLGLQKTRLLDPTLNFMGTNDHPGDFRASGCTACHTPYANDRDPFHSGAYAKFGNRGESATIDPTIPKGEPGHPIRHTLLRNAPSSQCVVCHMHPGTSYANSYFGYMWWDNESDGERMYPRTSMKAAADAEWRSFRRNPEAASKKGLWGDLYPDATDHTGARAGGAFLEQIGEPRPDAAKVAEETPGGDSGATSAPVFNDLLKHNQFADFHGHGWVFRAVQKKDRLGNLLDAQGGVIDPNDPAKWDKTVHLRDIHAEKGMHCVDCHFEQDAHGDGRLYGEPRAAVEISCVDCHGTYSARATLRTSGPAALPSADGKTKGRDLSKSRVFGELRFERREDGLLYQRSALDPKVEWRIVETVDTIDPNSAWAAKNTESARASRYAKTVKKGSRGATWGDISATPEGQASLAHGEGGMGCATCHTSWMTSCFGCHLPMKANQRTPMLHNESLMTRNYTQYNFQVLRDDVFMLGRDGALTGGKVTPVRSSSAVVVSSQNANREWVYHQQQTASAEGYSGQAFNPHFAHAVSGAGTTKKCTDCHVSEQNDNNAWMAQLLLQGTNFVNFFGRYVYVAEGEHGLEAVAVTEHDEPQAVYGSHLHGLAYPDEAGAFEKGGRGLKEAHHHDAGAPFEDAAILDVQLRGEYLYAARGKAGFWAYDVANIDNKGFSERITSAPVSPLGQRLGFDTKHCVVVASPATVAVDPARTRLSEDPTKPAATMMEAPEAWHVNQEQRIHPLYAYLYVGDSEEGLILTNAATLLDGDPDNNFMDRAKLADGTTAFNPDGRLTGLTALVVVGTHVYATSPAGLTVIDIDEPLNPKVAATVGTEFLREPQGVQVQFRYAFVTDAEGLKTIEVTDPAAPRAVSGALAPIEGAGRVYVSRTRAFVAAGQRGMVIVDITNPEAPAIEREFNAGGAMDDVRDVKVGMTNASLFAYVADGKNGLRVVRLMGPESTAQFRGFSPPLEPALIATYHTHGEALAISEGLDRDRAVDESGNQVAVFGRLGARPLTLEEMRRMYVKDGEVWKVSDSPTTEPEEFTLKAAEEKKQDGAPTRRRRGG